MTLRRPTLDHLYAVLPWRAQIPETLRTSRRLTRADQRRFYEDVIMNPESRDRYWAIIGAKQVFLGLVSLEHIDRDNSHAEIGLLIDPIARSCGYGTEAVWAVMRKACGLRLKTLWGECYHTNLAGVRFWTKVTERWGGSMTTWPRRKVWQGQLYGALLFTIPLTRRMR